MSSLFNFLPISVNEMASVLKVHKIKISIILGSVISLILIIVSLRACLSESDLNIETYMVKRGDFIFSVTETGELEAVKALNISAPMIPWNLGSLKITHIIEDGDEVKEGDILAEFDKGQVQKSMEEARSELEITQAQLRKAYATQKSQIQEMEANLEKAQLQLRIAKLNLEMADFKAKIEQKKIELQLKNAEIDLFRAKEQVENQRSINRQEISKLKLKVSQAQTRLDEAISTIEKLTLVAPAPGIAIIEKNWYTGNKFQTDDQPWRGQKLIRLPDLAIMQAKVMINEVDISKIDTTQRSKIIMDAYPDSSFNARVISIAALARNKERDSKVKIFDVILLLEDSDERLMPGMTISSEIIVDQIFDTLFIPLEAVFMDKKGPFVYLQNGDDFSLQYIKTGLENDNYVVIEEGLAEHDEIALMDPALIWDDFVKKR